MVEESKDVKAQTAQGLTRLPISNELISLVRKLDCFEVCDAFIVNTYILFRIGVRIDQAEAYAMQFGITNVGDIPQVE